MRDHDYLPCIFVGTVKKGRQLGRKLGYPTANLSSENGKMPSIPHGVYAGRTIVGKESYLSIMSFGRAETIGADDVLFETHLLDYHGDLYGENIEVEVIIFLRDMMKFDSLDDLMEAMKDDEKKARVLLSKE